MVAPEEIADDGFDDCNHSRLVRAWRHPSLWRLFRSFYTVSNAHSSGQTGTAANADENCASLVAHAQHLRSSHRIVTAAAADAFAGAPRKSLVAFLDVAVPMDSPLPAFVCRPGS